MNSYFTGRSQRIYLPFAEGERTLKLGLKSLKLEDWIEIDDQFAFYLQRKMELLETKKAEVFASLEGSEIAQKEVLDGLIDHLLRYFPEFYERSQDHITVRLTGKTWRISDFKHPLDLAGRLVQEDLCVMQKQEDRYLLTAASLCFPSRWRLVEKIGRPLVEIHQPVPGYADHLARPVDQVFDRLKSSHSGVRLNWSIHDTPELHLGNQSASNNPGEQLWIRVERQTLRRFEHCILFGIRTYRYPIEILQDYPEMAKGLREIVRSLSLEMRLYKSLEPIRERLLAIL